MSRTHLPHRTRSAAAAGLAAALGLAACGVTDTAPRRVDAQAAHAPSADPADQHTVIGCDGAAEAEPGTLVLACADGNATITDLRWTGWGTAQAKATGVLHRNTCEPSCAAGRFEDGRAVAVLSAPVQLDDGSVYTRLAVAADWTTGQSATWEEFDLPVG